MDPVLIIGAVNGAIALIEQLAPLIQQMVQKGEITPQQQSNLDARIAALRPGGAAFAGPEWQPSK